MALLTKEQILSADDLTRGTVDVPEWGGEVLIQTVTGTDRDRFEQDVMGLGQGKRVENFRARLVAKCIVDDAGNRIFSDLDVVALGKKSASALQRVFDACAKLNKFGEAEVKELAGN